MWESDANAMTLFVLSAFWYGRCEVMVAICKPCKVEEDQRLIFVTHSLITYVWRETDPLIVITVSIPMTCLHACGKLGRQPATFIVDTSVEL